MTSQTADYAADIVAELAKTSDQEFLERLIKESPEAELIMMDCGRIRLLKAAKAAVLLYMKMFADAAQSAGRTERKPFLVSADETGFVTIQADNEQSAFQFACNYFGDFRTDCRNHNRVDYVNSEPLGSSMLYRYQVKPYKR